MAKKTSSKKVSIELDPKTAMKLAAMAHQGVTSSIAYLAKTNPSPNDLASSANKVKIQMDAGTAKELSKKLNDQLLTASAAYLAKK